MSAWRSARGKLEVALVQLGMRLVGLLPRWIVLRLAQAAGWLGYYLSPFSRRVARANVDLVYGEALTPREKALLIRRSFQHFAQVILDLFWFTRKTSARVRRWVQVDESALRTLNGGRCVCLTGHLGNWELLGLTCAEYGYRLASVAMPLKNPAVDKMLNRLRQRTGQLIIPREGAVRESLRILRSGGYVAFLLDQNTPVEEGGIFVPFFGHPATVSTAAVYLAGRTQARIVAGFCLPEKNGRYLVKAVDFHGTPPMKPTEAEVREWTARIAQMYEEQIRRRPECWLWAYKRWKYVPPGEDRDRFPFYARTVSE